MRINVVGSFPSHPLVSCWSAVGQTQPEDRGKRCQENQYIEISIPILPSTVPTPTHTPKNRAGQRSAEMDLEDKLITTSMVILKF